MIEEMKQDKKFAKYVPPKDCVEAPVGKMMFTDKLIKDKGLKKESPFADV